MGDWLSVMCVTGVCNVGGGDFQPQPFWQARYYDFKLWIE
jgi:hypothetical protein